MANPYPATFIDGNAEGRLVGELDFTDPANQPGGGSSSIQTLGPLVVAWNTPNIASDYVKLVDLPIETVLVKMAVFVTAAWDAGGHLTLVDDATGTTTIWRSTSTLDTEGVSRAAIASSLNAADPGWLYTTSGKGIWATIDSSAASGAVAFYAVTSVPA